jgi:hypothetical protein
MLGRLRLKHCQARHGRLTKEATLLARQSLLNRYHRGSADMLGREIKRPPADRGEQKQGYDHRVIARITLKAGQAGQSSRSNVSIQQRTTKNAPVKRQETGDDGATLAVTILLRSDAGAQSSRIAGFFEKGGVLVSMVVTQNYPAPAITGRDGADDHGTLPQVRSSSLKRRQAAQLRTTATARQDHQQDVSTVRWHSHQHQQGG